MTTTANPFETIWEQYVATWKLATTAEKQAAFASCLATDCVYIDPLMQTSGWDQLATYMQDFHQQIPGGHFVTTQFIAHHHKSIARWEMRSGEGAVLGDGISYGEYDAGGKLAAMTGFFETPAE